MDRWICTVCDDFPVHWSEVADTAMHLSASDARSLYARRADRSQAGARSAVSAHIFRKAFHRLDHVFLTGHVSAVLLVTC